MRQQNPKERIHKPSCEALGGREILNTKPLVSTATLGCESRSTKRSVRKLDPPHGRWNGNLKVQITLLKPLTHKALKWQNFDCECWTQASVLQYQVLPWLLSLPPEHLASAAPVPERRPRLVPTGYDFQPYSSSTISALRVQCPKKRQEEEGRPDGREARVCHGR